MERTRSVAASSALAAGTLRQGDLLSGLAAAVTGLGDPPPLPVGVDEPTIHSPDDLWTVTFEAPTGWYAVCSQDCDLARDDAAEPTVAVAPVVWLPNDTWTMARSDSYTSRFFGLPKVLPDTPDGSGPAVDLAWPTSVAKASLRHSAVQVLHPLTGPQRRQFAAWAGHRWARVPFPDDVVEAVLDPAYEVRRRLMKRFVKAQESGQQAPADAQAVGACTQWYAEHLEARVTLLGRTTPEALSAAGLVDAEGQVLDAALEKGRVKLESQIRKRMQREAPNSGYGIRVTIATFSDLRASDVERFALLMR